MNLWSRLFHFQAASPVIHPRQRSSPPAAPCWGLFLQIFVRIGKMSGEFFLPLFGKSQYNHIQTEKGRKSGGKRSDFAVWVCFKHTAIWFVKPFVSTVFSGGCANWLWYIEFDGGKKNGGERGIRTMGKSGKIKDFLSRNSDIQNDELISDCWCHLLVEFK